MQERVKEFNLSQKHCWLLVGGMKRENMLIATPLPKRYIDHGMEVTIKGFVDKVTNSRRLGYLANDYMCYLQPWN